MFDQIFEWVRGKCFLINIFKMNLYINLKNEVSRRVCYIVYVELWDGWLCC